MNRGLNISGIGVVLSSMALFLLIFSVGAGSVVAAPKTGQIKNMWENQYKAPVLDIQYKGGERATNQINNKHYLTPVGTCWDYDVVELQKCGCRQFTKASVCCMKGSSSDCEIRIGNSALVDCSKYGKPKYGRSGDTEPPECKKSRNQSDCFTKARKYSFGPGYVIGPCKGVPYFTCPSRQGTVDEFYKKKCGPTPEDCGCTIEEQCSEENHLKCYNEWKKGIKGQSSLPVPETAKTDQQGVQPKQDSAGPTVKEMKKLFKNQF